MVRLYNAAVGKLTTSYPKKQYWENNRTAIPIASLDKPVRIYECGSEYLNKYFRCYFRKIY